MATDTIESLQAEYERVLPSWEAAWRARHEALTPIMRKGRAIAEGTSRVNPTIAEHDRLDQAIARETELRRQLDDVVVRLRRL
jgi:hypothetical protein